MLNPRGCSIKLILRAIPWGGQLPLGPPRSQASACSPNLVAFAQLSTQPDDNDYEVASVGLRIARSLREVIVSSGNNRTLLELPLLAKLIWADPQLATKYLAQLKLIPQTDIVGNLLERMIGLH